MGKSKKITCVVSGKPTVFTNDYLESKIAEYGSEKILEEQYISREVKSFLKKGYKIVDIRKVLNVDDTTPLPPLNVINILETKFATAKTSTLAESLSAIASFTFDRSDPEVEKFINSHIIKK